MTDIRNVYTNIIQSFAKYSSVMIILIVTILVIHFFDTATAQGFKYMTNIIMSMFVIYFIEKFLLRRIGILSLKSDTIDYILYYFFIIFVTEMIMILSFLMDRYILTNLIKSAYVVIFLTGFFSLNKLLFRYEQH